MNNIPFAFMAGQAGAPTPTPSPGGAIITTGLQQYFDVVNTSSYPGSGTEWFDLISLGGAGYKFNFIGGPTYSGENGGSIYFNGSNQYARQIGSNATLNYQVGSNFTVQMYMLLGPSMSSLNGEILSKWNGSSGEYNYAMRWQVAGPTGFRSPMYDASNSCNPNALATTDLTFEWELVTMTVDWTTDTLRTILPAAGTSGINTSIGCLINIVNTNPLDLMQRGNGSNDVEGYVQAVMIYDRVLSDAEITANFNYLETR